MVLRVAQGEIYFYGNLDKKEILNRSNDEAYPSLRRLKLKGGKGIESLNKYVVHIFKKSLF